MGFSKEDVEAMKDRVAKNAGAPVLLLKSVGVRARGSTEPRDQGMNKTEKAYSMHLDREMAAGRIAEYKFEAMRLRLADNTTLTPDFMVIDCDGFVQFHDTKATWNKTKNTPHCEDDFAVKIKVAAEQYPFFSFRIVWLFNNLWQERIY